LLLKFKNRTNPAGWQEITLLVFQRLPVCLPVGGQVGKKLNPPAERAGVLFVRWHFLSIFYLLTKFLSLFGSFFALPITFSIRIVADCVALSCQVTRKFKRATTLEFTTISAIIFIHCYVLGF